MARNLKNLGIHTLGQLAHYPLEVLESKFGVMGNQLYYHAWGVDLSLLEGNLYPSIPKSIGKGITLEEDYRDGDRVRQTSWAMRGHLPPCPKTKAGRQVYI